MEDAHSPPPKDQYNAITLNPSQMAGSIAGGIIVVLLMMALLVHLCVKRRNIFPRASNGSNRASHSPNCMASRSVSLWPGSKQLLVVDSHEQSLSGASLRSSNACHTSESFSVKALTAPTQQMTPSMPFTRYARTYRKRHHHVGFLIRHHLSWKRVVSIRVSWVQHDTGTVHQPVHGVVLIRGSRLGAEGIPHPMQYLVEARSNVTTTATFPTMTLGRRYRSRPDTVIEEAPPVWRAPATSPRSRGRITELPSIKGTSTDSKVEGWLKAASQASHSVARSASQDARTVMSATVTSHYPQL